MLKANDGEVYKACSERLIYANAATIEGTACRTARCLDYLMIQVEHIQFQEE